MGMDGSEVVWYNAHTGTPTACLTDPADVMQTDTLSLA
jgi:hypothetical protein